MTKITKSQSNNLRNHHKVNHSICNPCIQRGRSGQFRIPPWLIDEESIPSDLMSGLRGLVSDGKHHIPNPYLRT